MNNSLNVLLELVKGELFNYDVNLKIEDEFSFYKLTKENGLIGLIFNKLNKENISNKLFKSLEKDFFSYLKLDHLQIKLINELKELFNLNCIKHLFLKGSHLKSLYKESYQRGMGDIDILIEEKSLNDVNKLLLHNNFTLTSKSISHYVYKSSNNLNLEIHPFLYTNNKKYQEFLKEPFNYAYLNKDYNYLFNPNYELVYLIYHLDKHLRSGGIGLRSILDVGIFMKAYHNKLNEKELIKLINQAEMLEFFKVIVYLNEYLFNLKSNLKLMESFKLEERVLNNLINHLITSGIHGVGSEHNEFSARVAGKGKFRFLLRRLFPPYKEMIGFYPVLKKHPYLLGIFYIVRVFKVTVLRGKTNYKKLKKTTSVTNKKDIEELFKEIGL